VHCVWVRVGVCVCTVFPGGGEPNGPKAQGRGTQGDREPKGTHLLGREPTGTQGTQGSRGREPKGSPRVGTPLSQYLFGRFSLCKSTLGPVGIRGWVKHHGFASGWF
jgi:hypothetical protein